jgi:hypothetical protein
MQNDRLLGTKSGCLLQSLSAYFGNAMNLPLFSKSHIDHSSSTAVDATPHAPLENNRGKFSAISNAVEHLAFRFPILASAVQFLSKATVRIKAEQVTTQPQSKTEKADFLCAAFTKAVESKSEKLSGYSALKFQCADEASQKFLKQAVEMFLDLVPDHDVQAKVTAEFSKKYNGYKKGQHPCDDIHVFQGGLRYTVSDGQHEVHVLMAGFEMPQRLAEKNFRLNGDPRQIITLYDYVPSLKRMAVVATHRLELHDECYEETKRDYFGDIRPNIEGNFTECKFAYIKELGKMMEVERTEYDAASNTQQRIKQGYSKETSDPQGAMFVLEKKESKG